MTLLNPNLFLAGLACVAIPILIHFLMRRRRRVVRWGAMRFLLEAYRQQRRRMRLEQWLLLAARCLLVALIALALGRPVTKAAAALGGGGPTTLYILVDNSLTSQGLRGGVSALDRHKEAAARLIRGLDASRGDRVAVVTLAAPPEGLIMPPSADLASAEAALALIGPTESATDLHAGVALVSADAGAVEPERLSDAVSIAVLSEFREGSFDAERALPAALPAVRSRAAGPARLSAQRPAQAPATNISVLDAEPLTPVLFRGADAGPAPGTTVPVRVTLRRDGAGLAGAGATRVGVSIGRPGQREGATTGLASWSAGQARATLTLQASLPPRGQDAQPDTALVVHAWAEDEQAPGDNDLFRRAVVRDRVRVGVIAPAGAGGGPRSMDPAEWIRLALEPTDAGPWAGDDPDAQVGTRRIDPGAVSPAELAGLDAAIVAAPELLDARGWDALRRMVDSGAPVVVFPAAGASQAWTVLFLDRMGLDWTIAPEPRIFEPPTSLSLAPEADGSVLARLAPELPDLIAPVRVSRAIEIGPAGRAPSLVRVDGLPLLAVGSPASAAGGGLVVLMAAPLHLDWTDLPTKPLVVPLLHEVVRQAVGRSVRRVSASAGAASAAGLGLPPDAASLRALDGPAAGDGSRAPARIELRPGAGVSLVRAGVYQAADAGGATVALVTIDADARAGLVSPTPESVVSSYLGAMSTEPGSPAPTPVRWIGDSDPGPQAAATPDADASPAPGADRWSLWLLAGALALAAVELVLARLFSHASRTAGGEPARAATPAAAGTGAAA
jgi:hypothetical protein